MGNYSFLRAMRNNPKECIIDWDLMKKENLTHYYFNDLPNNPARPKTLEDMAEYWNEKKFVGYLTKEYIESLVEFCKGLVPYGSNPRLFYEYEGMEQIWCVEFIPGTGIVNIGIYDYHHIMTALPKHPTFPSELYDEWMSIQKSVENYCKKSCIDMYPWRFEQLKHRELSEDEQIDIFRKMLLG